jgi:hypothetical protein
MASNNTENKMNNEIKVAEIEVVDGNPVVRGTIGDRAWVAEPLRWGSKMLMKAVGDDLTRGERIALGHAAKKALKTAGVALPEALLKRPRKAKVEVVTPAASESSDSGERTEVEFTTLEEAVAEVS